MERWVGSGLLVAEQQLRKAIGYRQIPLLLASIANALSQKPVAKRAAIAQSMFRGSLVFNGIPGNLFGNPGEQIRSFSLHSANQFLKSRVSTQCHCCRILLQERHAIRAFPIRYFQPLQGFFL